MEKFRKATLLVLLLSLIFLNFQKANANLFGSSFEGCVEPEDDPVGYILEKSGDSNLTRDDIKRVLKYVPTSNNKEPYNNTSDFLKTKVSYGDIFVWLRTTENSVDCFLEGDYEKGLSIFGSHAGKFAASKALGEAVASIVGSSALIPVELFDWQMAKILNDFEIAAVNHQLIFYIAAIENCEENGSSTANCQQEIIDASKNGIDGAYHGVLFNINGFILEVEAPKNPRFISAKTINGLSWFEVGLGRSLSSRIQLTPEQFYKGAAVIYNSMVAKQKGKLKIVEAALIKNVTEEVHNLSKTSAEKPTETPNPNLLQQIWSTISTTAKSIIKATKNIFNGNNSSQKNPQPGLVSEGLEKAIQKPSGIFDSSKNIESLPPVIQQQTNSADDEKKAKLEKQKQENQKRIEEAKRNLCVY